MSWEGLQEFQWWKQIKCPDCGEVVCHVHMIKGAIRSMEVDQERRILHVFTDDAHHKLPLPEFPERG